MTVPVVFESHWGNTEQVARALAAGLRESEVEVAVASVEDAPRDPLVAFDTKVSHPNIPGSAAKAAVRLAKRADFTIEAEPETFWVHDMAGPLDAGQLDRARQWGHELAAHARALG